MGSYNAHVGDLHHGPVESAIQTLPAPPGGKDTSTSRPRSKVTLRVMLKGRTGGASAHRAKARLKCILPLEQLRRIAADFQTQMVKGLNGEPSSLPMLPSFAVTLPTGAERGQYYALDLGGTNFRMLRVQLSGASCPPVVDIKQVAIPAPAMQGTAETLFAFIASNLGDFLAEFGPVVPLSAEGSLPLGFCFSFPMTQTSLQTGTLLAWTKGFQNTTGVGSDIVALLSTELRNRSIHMHVVALLNDTVGTLAAGRHQCPDTLLSIILGTGTNAAYIERTSAIGKLPSSSYGSAEQMVINTEWGQFESKFIPMLSTDRDLDAASAHPETLQRGLTARALFLVGGAYRFEKLISGMWLGDAARRILVKLAQQTRCFGAHVPCQTHLALSTPDMAIIDGDCTVDLRLTRAENALRLPAHACSIGACTEVKKVCGLVRVRAARLIAAAIAAMVARLDHAVVHVAIDGGLYEGYTQLSRSLDDALKQLLPFHDVRMCLARDGSGTGAALLAAAAS